MATKKAVSSKKTTAKKPSATTKTTVRTLNTKTAAASKPTAKPSRPAVAASAAKRGSSAIPSNIVSVVFAELVGTFALTLVFMTSLQETAYLFIGLTVAAVALVVGVISGAHLNPAITFGFWAMRRLKSVLLPFYWGAQFLGAMLAVIVLNLITNGALRLDFGHFTSFNWSIFGVELVGAALLMFIAAAAVARQVTNAGRAVGLGLAFAVALAGSGALYSKVYKSEVASYQQSAATSTSREPEIPHAVYVGGPVLNPAVSLAVTEKTKGELMSGTADKDDKQYSRLTLELIVGTLVGAALGGNLFLLINGRRTQD